jgi:hypothetical protein
MEELCFLRNSCREAISETKFGAFFTASGVGLSPLYCGHFWPILPAPDDRWGWLWSNWWNEEWQRNPKYSEKTCLSATLSTTNTTWPELGSNPGRRGGKPATNRLSYGAAQVWSLVSFLREPGGRGIASVGAVTRKLLVTERCTMCPSELQSVKISIICSYDL